MTRLTASFQTRFFPQRNSSAHRTVTNRVLGWRRTAVMAGFKGFFIMGQFFLQSGNFSFLRIFYYTDNLLSRFVCFYAGLTKKALTSAYTQRNTILSENIGGKIPAAPVTAGHTMICR